MNANPQKPPGQFETRAIQHLRACSADLTRGWLEALRGRLPEDSRRIFPDETLLNGIPGVLEQLFLSILHRDDPTHLRFVDDELRALSNLRRSQGYQLDEVVAEFELLRGLIIGALLDFAELEPEPIPPREALEVAGDFEAAFRSIIETTARTFVDAASDSRQGRAELLGSFGRAVTHELRNRLNAAMMTLEAFRQTATIESRENRDLLENLAGLLRKVERVVPDVFSVAMAQSHHANIEGNFEPLDELVAQALEDSAELASARGVTCRIEGELPCFPVDSTRIRLILINFLTNAIKYRDRSKDERWVEVCATRTDERPREWRLDVRDNGVGIPVELQPFVFEENLRSPDSGAETGEGIGLSLARSAAFQLGGRIWCTSRPGVGSTFSFTLSEPSSGLEG